MNNIDNINTKEADNENIKDKTLRAIVTSMGMDFNKVKYELAEFAGIPRDQYKSNYNQNMLIRQKLIEGQFGELKSFDEALSKFSENKQKIIKRIPGGEYDIRQMTKFIQWLTSAQIEKFNTLDDKQFYFFLRQSMETITKVTWWWEQSDELTDNAVIFLELKLIDEHLEDICRKYNKSIDDVVKKENLNELWNDPKYIYLKEKSLEKADGDEKKAKEFFRTFVLVEKMAADEQFKTDDEFKSVVNELYKKSLEWWIQLREIWSEALYAQIQAWFEEASEVTDSPMENIKNEVMYDDDINEYFKNNGIRELVTEEKKDDEYYESLRKLYPKLDDLIQEDVYIQKIMKKENKTDKEKEWVTQRIQKLARGSEKLLKNETNTIIQEEAVIGCVEVLKSYMDINITETENVLEQFKRVKEEEDDDMVQKSGKDIVLDIKGDINGKRLNLQYNLTDGTLWEEEFLSRWAINAPFILNDPEKGKKQIADINLPKLGDFTQGASNVDYASVIKNAGGIKEYRENFAKELKTQAQIGNNRGVEEGKTLFERTVIKNMAAQDVLAFMGKKNDMAPESFSVNQDGEIYAMYTLLYNSLDYYTISQLKRFRKSMADISYQKQQYVYNRGKKGINTEKHLLSLMDDQERDFATNKSDNKQNTYIFLHTYANFFSIFTTRKGNLPIMDIATMEKFTVYMKKEESLDQSYMQEPWMKSGFNELITILETSWELAELDEQLEDLPD